MRDLPLAMKDLLSTMADLTITIENFTHTILILISLRKDFALFKALTASGSYSSQAH
jgi:hypothetical protein